MAQLNFDAQKLVPFVLIIVAAFVMLGVWNRVSALEARVIKLNSAVEDLADVQVELEAVREQMVTVRADVADIAAAREDILEGICRVLELPPERCLGVAA